MDCYQLVISMRTELHDPLRALFSAAFHDAIDRRASLVRIVEGVLSPNAAQRRGGEEMPSEHGTAGPCVPLVLCVALRAAM